MGKTFDFEEAQKRIKAGEPCHPDYFGKGWKTVYDNGSFWDVNPVTGSQLFHSPNRRDAVAAWRSGPAPEDY